MAPDVGNDEQHRRVEGGFGFDWSNIAAYALLLIVH
jgi:hypothetical protein